MEYFKKVDRLDIERGSSIKHLKNRLSKEEWESYKKGRKDRKECRIVSSCTRKSHPSPEYHGCEKCADAVRKEPMWEYKRSHWESGLGSILCVYWFCMNCFPTKDSVIDYILSRDL